MTRLLGPDEGSRLAYLVRGDTIMQAYRLSPVTIYADAGAAQLADILTYPGGVTVPGSVLETDQYGMLPYFQLPDGVDTVYALIPGGQLWPVYARFDDRIDAIAPLTGVVGSAYAATMPLISKLRMNKRDAATIVQYGDSTSATIGAWPGILATEMAALWPAWSFKFADWSVETNTNFSAPGAISTGSGTGVVTWYNHGIPSTNTPDVLGSHFANAVLNIPDPDLFVIGHGHNEYAGPSTSAYDPPAYSQMAAFLATLRLYHPTVPILLVLQNPVAITANATQERRNDPYRRLAGDLGIGLVDVFHAFTGSPLWSKAAPGPLMADDTHPSALGYQLWADTMLPYFSPPADPNSELVPYGSPQQSPLATRRLSLLVNGDFSSWTGGPDGWAAVGSPTVTQDTGTVDTAEGTKTYSIKVAASGSAIGYLTQTLPIALVRGKNICLTVREFVSSTAPTGNASGMLGIVIDGVETQTGTTNYGRDGWFYRSIHAKVPSTANAVSVRLYGSTSASTAGVAFFSEAAATVGALPARALPPTGITTLPYGLATVDPLDVGEEVFSRAQQTSSVSMSTQRVVFSYFTARKTETTTQARVTSGATPASGLTLAKIGLYLIDGTGAGTLVAQTASDTSLFGSANSPYTRAWLASYAKVAGQRYALAVLTVGTTPGTVCGYASTMPTELGVSPRQSSALTGQADLPASFTGGSVAVFGGALYGAVLP